MQLMHCRRNYNVLSTLEQHKQFIVTLDAVQKYGKEISLRNKITSPKSGSFREGQYKTLPRIQFLKLLILFPSRFGEPRTESVEHSNVPAEVS